MLTYEEILNNCSNYIVKNNKIYEKNTNIEVVDEDKILRIKSSILLFKEARKDYEEIIKMFGKTDKPKDYFLKKAMEKYGANNEENNYGINKLINAIINNDGHYEENMSGSDLQESKFSILLPPKKDYTISYLKLKFRKKGLDIDDIKISQDISNLKKDGYSTVILDYKIKKYIKEQTLEKDKSYHHKYSQELNELERQKQYAKETNDEVLLNYASKSIENIVKNNPSEVSSEDWEKLSYDEKISFINLKIKESKILHNEEDYKYYTSVLKSLESNNLKEKIEKLKKLCEQNFLDYNNDITLEQMEGTLKSAYILKESATDETDIENISEVISLLEEKVNLNIKSK